MGKWTKQPGGIYKLELPTQTIRVCDGTPMPKPAKRSGSNARKARVESTAEAPISIKPKKERRHDVPIPAKTDRFVRVRDNNTCVVCGFTIGEERPDGSYVKAMHVDHIVPRAQWGDRPGGVNDESNLRCACDRCNLGKGAQAPAKWEKQPDAIVSQLREIVGKKNKKGGAS